MEQVWGTNIGFGRMGREGKWFNREEGDIWGGDRGRGKRKRKREGEEGGRGNVFYLKT